MSVLLFKYVFEDRRQGRKPIKLRWQGRKGVPIGEFPSKKLADLSERGLPLWKRRWGRVPKRGGALLRFQQTSQKGTPLLEPPLRPSQLKLVENHPQTIPKRS